MGKFHLGLSYIGSEGSGNVDQVVNCQWAV